MILFESETRIEPDAALKTFAETTIYLRLRVPKRPFSERHPHLLGDIVRGVGIVAFGWLFFGDPEAVYCSSDGKWADSEIKNRTFAFIVVPAFQAYKMACHAPDAALLRTTPEVWWNVFAWPSYLFNPKWRVPYSDAHAEIGDDYPPLDDKHCSDSNLPFNDLDIADKRANAYIARLKAQ